MPHAPNHFPKHKIQTLSHQKWRDFIPPLLSPSPLPSSFYNQLPYHAFPSVPPFTLSFSLPTFPAPHPFRTPNSCPLLFSNTPSLILSLRSKLKPRASLFTPAQPQPFLSVQETTPSLSLRFRCLTLSLSPVTHSPLALPSGRHKRFERV